MSALEIIGASLAYVLAGVVPGRLLAGHLAWRWFDDDREKYPSAYGKQQTPSTGQWFGAGCVGLLCVFIWPVILGFHVLRLERWAVGAEARGLASNREKRIAELEKELNLP